MSGPPILGLAAYSGTGKTTLLTRLVPLLRAGGLRVSVVKHAHHSFDIDTPGKDSYRLRQAGASPVMVASRQRWVLMAETPGQEEPRLEELLEQLPAQGIDLVLVEGFKHERFPKIELHRPELGRPRLYPDDASIIAVASDAPLSPPPPVPVLDLNRADTVRDFVLGWLAGPGARRGLRQAG